MKKKTGSATWGNKKRWTNTVLEHLVNCEGNIGYIYLNEKMSNKNISHYGLFETPLSHNAALFCLFPDNLCVKNSHVLFLAVNSAAKRQQDKN